MKTVTLLAACLALFATACGGGDPATDPTIQLAKGTASLHITVAKIRDSKGEIFCGLFNSPTGFPGPSPIIGGSLKAPANGAMIECDYDNLPAGTYAVSSMHDENGNGQLDKNVLGIPTEGHGATNNVTHPTSGPTFDDAHVDVADGAAMNLTINLAY